MLLSTCAMSESSLPLVTQATSRNRDAIEALLVRHMPGLRAWLQVRMGCQLRARETPDDLLQSVAREALGDLGDFEWRGEAAFRHWLYVKAQRKLIDKARHVGAARRSPLRERAIGMHGEAVLAAFGSPTPSRELQSREELRRIEKAIAELPEDYREAISLRRLCGMSYGEIAERMTRSAPAVRNLVHRGLSRLALRLGELRDQDGG